jgi:hypothetical protein
VHSCACDPKIMQHEDLKTAPSKRHSINQSCPVRILTIICLLHTSTFLRPFDLSDSSRSAAVNFRPASYMLLVWFAVRSVWNIERSDCWLRGTRQIGHG